MADEYDEFDAGIGELRERAGEIHKTLAKQNIRVFCPALKSGGKYKTKHWIHDSKSVAEWRADVRVFLEACDERDEEGWADDHVHNTLSGHMMSLGYVEVDDIVADVFEGRITNSRAKIEHYPAHDDQPDGFGHYGWENGGNSK